MGDDRAYSSFQSQFSGNDEYNQLDFVVRSILSGVQTCTLVRVMAVETGGVGPVGFVDVQPLVAQVDGSGKPVAHGTVHGLPYLRLQGGTTAVIIDPAVGDIGLACFASHDISSVKANRAPANPGSRRRFNMADGLYLGGMLNGTPQQYMRFTPTGDVEIKPASMVTVLGKLVVTEDVEAAGVSLVNHVHPGVQTGTGETEKPLPTA